MEIKKGTAFRVPARMRKASDGSAVTGLVYTDVTLYIQKQASASELVSVGVGDWIEVDATNMPGAYDIALGAVVFDTIGFLKYVVSAATCEPYYGLLEVVGNVEADTYARAARRTPLTSLSSPAFWDIAEDIPIEAMVASPDTGHGLSGKLAALSLTISRLSDGKFWNGSTWQVGLFSLTSATGLAEVDAVNAPGRYRLTLPGIAGNVQADRYDVHWALSDAPTVEGDIFEVVRSRDLNLTVIEGEPA